MNLYRIPALVACAAALLCIPQAQAQDFTTWSKLISFRPDGPVQEKLMARKADVNGNRWKTLKIERARGGLFMQTASMVITKMPASDGKPLTIAATFRRIRSMMEELFDPAKATFTLDDAADKEKWSSDNPSGVIVKINDLANKVEYPFLTGDSGTDRLVLCSLSGSVDPSPLLVSGNVSITISGAAPLEGCIVQVRAAFRPTSAATQSDEWLAAERFAGLWLDFLEHVRKFVKDHNGECVPELAPPTLAAVAWNTVAKSLHQPSTTWVGLEGSWRSTDREQRFRIEFHGDNSCDLVERNKDGKELRVTIPVMQSDDPKQGYILERPNDKQEVLEFYDFKADTRAAIIERKPEPSRMVFKRNSKGKIVGFWQGFSISRDAFGKISDIKQPSKMQAKIFEFVPISD